MEAEPQTRKIYWSLILIFLYFSAAIVVAGYSFFLHQKTKVKKEVWRQVDAILTLKTNEIVNWREERKTDGAAILKNPFLAPRIQQFLKNPKAVGSQKDVIDWMESILRPGETRSYKCVVLLKPSIEVALSVPAEKRSIDPFSKQLAIEAGKDRKIILSDLYRDESSNAICASLFVPILGQTEGKPVTVAVVMLEIDPNLFLYPLIQTWPVPSETAESLLVRREGEEVLFLNELRHRKNTALVLRTPISRSQLLAARVARGEEGIVEGLDYRGVPVVGAIGKIPGSPWFFVAKVDQQEIYAPIRTEAALVSILVALLVLTVAVSVGFLWRGQYLEEHRLREKDIRKLNEDLERRAEELEKKNEELEAFSYSLSHDVRNPLIGIKGLSHMILEEHKHRLDDKILHLLGIMETEAQKTLQLIDGLLSFFRIQHQEVSFTVINMEDLGRTVFDELKTIMPIEGIKLDTKLLNSSCGDRTMIRQVFYNLLSNAIKFTRPKENGRIEIGCRSGEKEDVFYVKDNGIGFDMKDASKMFEAFQRLHPANKFEGMGIGLAIVKRIVQRHGGRLWAEGAANEGATFYFSLPKRENCSAYGVREVEGNSLNEKRL